ncbi:hypothetical protein E4T56_gene9200 [Termitomyces sp. T112]|nr:hypothetical protein E4T56_gene9200 [Termitomyces sp. T112]
MPRDLVTARDRQRMGDGKIETSLVSSSRKSLVNPRKPRHIMVLMLLKKNCQRTSKPSYVNVYQPFYLRANPIMYQQSNPKQVPDFYSPRRIKGTISTLMGYILDR